MVPDPRNRKTIEVAPAVYEQIEGLVKRGYWLSFQEFAREALKEKLDRWIRENSFGPLPRRETLEMLAPSPKARRPKGHRPPG